MRDVPFDVFPEFAPPLVEVQTEAPGLSALEVESLVSVPLESALTGVPGVATHSIEVRARPLVGRADPGAVDADLMEARQLVQERLARVAARAAGRRPRTGAAVSALVAQPRDEDRHDL